MNITIHKNNQLLNWFFPAYYLLMFGQARGIIPLSGVFMVPFMAVLFFSGVRCISSNYRKNKMILVFIIYSLFTITSYLFIDRPVSLFFNDCIYFLIPALIAFTGLSRKQVDNKFYDLTFWSSLITLIIGYYIFFARPAWYQSFYNQISNNVWFRSEYIDFNDVVDSIRFSSFTPDSYYTEYIGMFVFSLGLVKMFKSKENKLLYMVFNLIIFGAVLLSMQRSAIVCCCLMIGAYFFYYLQNKNRKGQGEGNLKYIIYALLILLVIALALGTSEVVQKVLFRFTQMGASDAFEVEGSRTEQIQTTLASWENFVTGNGLGTASSKARSMGYPGISDGNYVKLLVEEGVVGFSIFMILMVSTFIRALKNFKYLSMECCVVGALLFTMLGSDSLMFTYYIVPYWYAVGKVWNPDYLNELKTNNISI